jgi:hypothetical protein
MKEPNTEAITIAADRHQSAARGRALVPHANAEVAPEIIVPAGTLGRIGNNNLFQGRIHERLGKALRGASIRGCRRALAAVVATERSCPS